MSGLLLLAGPLTGTARANGVPTLVNLTYIDLSNWGPEEATGTAELLFAEGLVNVSISGAAGADRRALPGLAGEFQVGDAITVGPLQRGRIWLRWSGELPGCVAANRRFRVRPVHRDSGAGAGRCPAADPRLRSVGGYFTLVGEANNDGEPAARHGAVNSTNRAAPAELPATGDFALHSDIVRVQPAVLAVMGLSVFVALRLGRRAA